jgi:hypothetical protein
MLTGSFGEFIVILSIFMILFVVAILSPLVLALIRFLNRTWLDPDWRSRRAPSQEEVSPAQGPANEENSQAELPDCPQSEMEIL